MNIGLSLTRQLATFVVAWALSSSSHALSLDKNMVLSQNEGKHPLSTKQTTDGGFVVTASRWVIKVDHEKNVAWTFEQPFQKGLATDLVNSVPLEDGSVMVCADRRQLPGTPPPHERFPGFLIKLDSSGKEIARYDPISGSRDKWPYIETMACGSWGHDVFVLAELAPPNHPAVLMVNGKETGQCVLTRMSKDLSIVSSGFIPCFGWAMRHPRTLETSDGGLVIETQAVIARVKSDGTLVNWSAVEDCVLVEPLRRSTAIRAICRESTHSGTPWEVRDFDQDLKVTGHFFLPNSTGDAFVAAACELPGDRFAIGTTEGYHADIISFGNRGKREESVALPGKIELPRPGVKVIDMFGTENGIAIMAHQMQDSNFTKTYDSIRLIWLKN